LTKNKSLLITYGKLSDLSGIKKIDNFFDDHTDKVYRSNKKNDLLNAIKNQKIIVAHLNGKITGYLWFEFLWSYIPFISLIRIEKSYQRTGTGKKLFIFFENKMIKKKYDRILSSTEEANEISIKFHKSLGFKKCGYFRLSKWIPKKELFYEKTLDN
tara:strand:- start:659 stop:1129 length:471 start_codon:yes stop_codon:yes gene_type:complete